MKLKKKIEKGVKAKRTKPTLNLPKKKEDEVVEKRGLGRPAATDTVISSTEAIDAVKNDEFDIDELLEVVKPSPGRGRALKDTDNLRIAGSRKFVKAALPFFKALFEQSQYAVHIDTHEKRDGNVPTGKYIAYIRFREKVEPRPLGRPKKISAAKGPVMKNATTRNSVQPKKDNAVGKAIDAGFDAKRANKDATKTAKVVKTGASTPGAKIGNTKDKSASKPANKGIRVAAPAKKSAPKKEAPKKAAPAKKAASKKSSKK